MVVRGVGMIIFVVQIPRVFCGGSDYALTAIDVAQMWVLQSRETNIVQKTFRNDRKVKFMAGLAMETLEAFGTS